MKRIPKVITLIPKARSFERGLLRGIANYSKLNGPWSFFNPPAFYLKREVGGEFLHKIRGVEPDGIIFREHEDKTVNELIIDCGVPTVFVPFDEKFTHLPSVVVDHKAVAMMAADHLIDQGCPAFGYVGYENMPWSNERSRYFTEHIIKAGYEPPIVYKPMLQGQRAWKEEVNNLVAFVRSLPKHTGLMACNDDRGSQVCEACRIAGLRVPDEIGIIGVDNDDLICNMSNPTLSSVAINIQKAGYKAARVLDQLMQNKKVADPHIWIYPSQTECRESTNIIMIGNQLVTDAIRFIHQNSNKPIQVSDVAGALCVSVRSLQVEFRNSCDHTVRDEIQKARLERVLNMLVSTNISIKQIAMDLGFSHPKHIARFFKREKGIGLREYRRKHGDL